jgi:hypothetical protein
VAELGFVELRVFFGARWIAFEALRLGAVVLFTPIALGLEIVGGFRAAHTALLFGNAVFLAPIATVIVVVVIRRVGFLVGFTILFLWLLATTGHCQSCDGKKTNRQDVHCEKLHHFLLEVRTSFESKKQPI